MAPKHMAHNSRMMTDEEWEAWDAQEGERGWVCRNHPDSDCDGGCGSLFHDLNPMGPDAVRCDKDGCGSMNPVIAEMLPDFSDCGTDWPELVGKDLQRLYNKVNRLEVLVDRMTRDAEPDSKQCGVCEKAACECPTEPEPSFGVVCSFCGAHEREVTSLIVGPRVSICSGCVGDCVAIVNDKARRRGDEPVWSPHDTAKPEGPCDDCIENGRKIASLHRELGEMHRKEAGIRQQVRDHSNGRENNLQKVKDQAMEIRDLQKKVYHNEVVLARWLKAFRRLTPFFPPKMQINTENPEEMARLVELKLEAQNLEASGLRERVAGVCAMIGRDIQADDDSTGARVAVLARDILSGRCQNNCGCGVRCIKMEDHEVHGCAVHYPEPEKEKA